MSVLFCLTTHNRHKTKWKRKQTMYIHGKHEDEFSKVRGLCADQRWAVNIQFTNLPIIKFKIWTSKNTVADDNLNPFNERQCRTTWTAKTLFGLKRWLVRRRSRSRAINDPSTSTTILCRHENCMLQRSGERKWRNKWALRTQKI